MHIRHNNDKISIIPLPISYTNEKGGYIMSNIMNNSIKETPKKKQDALEKSRYSILCERKETKYSLENAKRGLLAVR